MAHFAKISETNKVLGVLTLNNSDMLNSDGVEEESVGQTYLEQHNNWPEDDNIFWPEKPYVSWVKHNASACWKSPIGDAPTLTAEQILQNEAGTHQFRYQWNEENQSWDLKDYLLVS